MNEPQMSEADFWILKEIVGLVAYVGPLSYREYKKKKRECAKGSARWALLHDLERAVAREGVYPGDMRTDQIFSIPQMMSMAAEAHQFSRAQKLMEGRLQ